MINRAEQFVEWFQKWINVMWQNRPKDLAICIYIYARDTKIKTDEEPDWVIYTEKLSSLSKYDEYRIKQDVGNYLDNK